MSAAGQGTAVLGATLHRPEKRRLGPTWCPLGRPAPCGDRMSPDSLVCDGPARRHPIGVARRCRHSPSAFNAELLRFLEREAKVEKVESALSPPPFGRTTSSPRKRLRSSGHRGGPLREFPLLPPLVVHRLERDETWPQEQRLSQAMGAAMGCLQQCRQGPTWYLPGGVLTTSPVCRSPELVVLLRCHPPPSFSCRGSASMFIAHGNAERHQTCLAGARSRRCSMQPTRSP
jgi:hypothetical protein